MFCKAMFALQSSFILPYFSDFLLPPPIRHDSHRTCKKTPKPFQQNVMYFGELVICFYILFHGNLHVKSFSGNEPMVL